MESSQRARTASCTRKQSHSGHKTRLSRQRLTTRNSFPLGWKLKECTTTAHSDLRRNHTANTPNCKHTYIRVDVCRPLVEGFPQVSDGNNSDDDDDDARWLRNLKIRAIRHPVSKANRGNRN